MFATVAELVERVADEDIVDKKNAVAWVFQRRLERMQDNGAQEKGAGTEYQLFENLLKDGMKKLCPPSNKKKDMFV